MHKILLHNYGKILKIICESNDLKKEKIRTDNISPDAKRSLLKPNSIKESSGKWADILGGVLSGRPVCRTELQQIYE